MFSLVIKDILLVKKTILLGFAYMIFFLVAFQGMGNTAFISAVVAYTYILIMTIAAYEEKNNADILLNSFPIKRQGIVLSKYVSGLVCLVISIIIYWMITFFIQIFGVNLKVFPITAIDIISVLLSVSIVNGIYLPVFFKFGYIKSKFFNLILFLLIFAGASSIVGVFEEGQGNAFVHSILSFLNKQSEFQISLYLIGIILVITIVSYIISLYFYREREF